MAQILVRNLDEKVVRRLKQRAKREGRSLQAEVKMILEGAAVTTAVDREKALTQILAIRERLKGRKFPDSVELIREDRDR